MHMFVNDYPSSFGCFVVVTEPDHIQSEEHT